MLILLLAFTISIAFARTTHHAANLPTLVKPEPRYHFWRKYFLNHYTSQVPFFFALIAHLMQY